MLRQVTLFDELEEPSLGLLAAGAVLRPHRKGDAIVRQGEFSHSLLIVVSGIVEAVLESPSGESVRMHEFRPATISVFLTDQNGPNEGAPSLVRWTLHRPSGRLTETVLDDRGNEFPRINERYGGQAYRYIYTAHWGDDVAFGPAMKCDLQRRTIEVHDYGPGRMTSEPVFVRKPGATSEDEGWILSYVYDPKRNLTDVVILDAQDFAGEPVATIRLPVRVPFGFHGGWAPDVVTVVE